MATPEEILSWPKTKILKYFSDALEEAEGQVIALGRKLEQLEQSNSSLEKNLEQLEQSNKSLEKNLEQLEQSNKSLRTEYDDIVMRLEKLIAERKS